MTSTKPAEGLTGGLDLEGALATATPASVPAPTPAPEPNTSSSEKSEGIKTFVLESLQKSHDAILADTALDEASREKLLKVAFRPKINRPYVYVAELIPGAKKDHVDSYEKLTKLLSSLPESAFEVEEAYCNQQDMNEVTVFRIKLPQNYVARVPYVQLQHVPQQFKRRREVYYPITSALGFGLCNTMPPLWSNEKYKEIPLNVIHDMYHCITLKVRSDGKFKFWIPGRDIDFQPCASFSEQFILVGPTREELAKQKSKDAPEQSPAKAV